MMASGLVPEQKGAVHVELDSEVEGQSGTTVGVQAMAVRGTPAFRCVLRKFAIWLREKVFAVWNNLKKIEHRIIPDSNSTVDIRSALYLSVFYQEFFVKTILPNKIKHVSSKRNRSHFNLMFVRLSISQYFTGSS